MLRASGAGLWGMAALSSPPLTVAKPGLRRRVGWQSCCGQCISTSRASGAGLWGGGGTTLATPDGGKPWTTQTSGAAAGLYAMHFHAEGERGWAVGGGGTILA